MKYLLLTVLAVCGLFQARAAKVDTVQIATKHIVSPAKAVVVTPDAKKGQTFPSVYILHGYGGSYRTWINNIRKDLPALADKYGMVFVLPDGRNSWYWDSPVDSAMQMESFFVDDLVPYVDAHYPTRREASQRAITGLSMGGHGGLWLGLRHSDIWGSAGSMSGGVDIRPFGNNWKMKNSLGSIDQYPERWNNSTVVNLVPWLKPGQSNIIIDCGVDDFFIDVNRNLHNLLVQYKIPHDYTERPGKHNGEYWNNSILYHLLYFNEAFNKATTDTNK